jgi:hypothetical protein
MEMDTEPSDTLSIGLQDEQLPPQQVRERTTCPSELECWSNNADSLQAVGFNIPQDAASPSRENVSSLFSSGYTYEPINTAHNGVLVLIAGSFRIGSMEGDAADNFSGHHGEATPAVIGSMDRHNTIGELALSHLASNAGLGTLGSMASKPVIVLV